MRPIRRHLTEADAIKGYEGEAMPDESLTVEQAVAAERLRCAKPVCSGCASYGAPIVASNLPHINGGTVSVRHTAIRSSAISTSNAQPSKFGRMPMVKITVTDSQTGFERTLVNEDATGAEIAQVVENYLKDFCQDVESVGASE